MDYILFVVIFLAGSGGGMWWQSQRIKKGIDQSRKKADEDIEKAKKEKEEILTRANNEAHKIIHESKKEEDLRRKEINALQDRLEKRETTFSKQLLELQNKQEEVYAKIEKIEKAKERLKEMKLEQEIKLEEIAKMTKAQAVEKIIEKAKEEKEEALNSRLKKMDQESSDVLEEKARNLIAGTCQRIAHAVTSEISSTVIDLPNDEMKGRIIGKEGRNIKTIETLTGTEIIIDDTPSVITISGFSLIRRHIAKKALENLILDGRIQPTKIEDAVEEAKKSLAIDMKKAGEQALYELGITGFDPKLVQIIGRLKYRTSYGQNTLLHSIQVARLSGFLAKELGADVSIAKKGGLLHDIGKAVDQEVQGTHPVIGGNIARKFGLPQELIDPIETHHDDRPNGLISIIVKVADAISGARQGARNDNFEKYIQRLDELEKVAGSFEGIAKVYAIQAGREVRVFVYPEQVNDIKARELARDIAKKIESELKYPGEIKINLIRETRIIEYAR